MPSSFPAAVKNFGTAKQDFTDNILAAHVNDLQDEVVGIESNLGVNPHIGQNLSGISTTYGSLKARIDDIMAGVRTHTHDGTQGVKLDQANTHQSPDTDTATTALHHTLGTGANQAAQGNHAHTGIPQSSVTNLVSDLAAKASLTGAETLTNKTLTSATNVFPSDILRGVGIVVMCANAAPSGFLLCDGSAVSRTTYATLYSYLGGAASVWGQGDGSTTFNVPDFRSRAPVGAGTGPGLSARALGGSGGAQDAVNVSHNHTGSSGGASVDHSHNANHGHTGGTSGAGSHSHSALATTRSIYAAGGTSAGLYAFDYNTPTTGVGDHSHGMWVDANNFNTSGHSADHSHAITVNTSGVSGTDANMSPWRGINFAIKF